MVSILKSKMKKVTDNYFHQSSNNMNKIVKKIKISKPSSILVVGCGRVGNRLVKEIFENIDDENIKIYITDVVKGRASDLSEHFKGRPVPIKWKNAKDTPDDIDLIIVCVDGDSEKKIIDRIVLSKKSFITLSDDNSVIKQYLKHQDTFKENNIKVILGLGLFPGIGNAVAEHISVDFDQVFDITVERLGFVSNSSLSSIKKARRDSPLGLRDTVLTESRKKNSKAYSWFPKPYGLLETQPVAVGVTELVQQFPNARNVSVRYSEPKLPTFKDRVRHLILREQLTSKNACIKVQVYGSTDSEIVSKTVCVKGDALNMVSITVLDVLYCILEDVSDETGIVLCSKYINPKQLFSQLHERGINLYDFDTSK